MLKQLFIIIFIMSLTSCSKISPKDYSQNLPKLDIRQFLNGKIKAYGIIENRKGKITRRFTVDMIGKWEGSNGILDESFIFDDGEQDQRLWKIKFENDHDFIATADDVIGDARGSQYGNTLQMKYILDLVIDKDTNKKYKVQLDDWMYLIDKKTLINKSEIKKFGITFAKLTIFFHKIDE